MYRSYHVDRSQPSSPGEGKTLLHLADYIEHNFQTLRTLRINFLYTTDQTICLGDDSRIIIRPRTGKAYDDNIMPCINKGCDDRDVEFNRQEKREEEVLEYHTPRATDFRSMVSFAIFFVAWLALNIWGKSNLDIFACHVTRSLYRNHLTF